MRIDRLLAITVLMLNRDRVTAAELAEKFEVSLRTIYRDMEAMSLAGIPVVPYSGNGGGFSLMDTYKLDKRLLKPQDIRVILSSISGLNRTLADPNMQSALDKICSLLPKGTSPNQPSLCEQLVIDLFPWNQNHVQVDRIRTIHKGIGESRLIRFSYQGMNGDSTLRTVEPMTLVFKGYGWYLFAYCLGRSDYRFFKISRMKDLSLCEDLYCRRPVSYESHLPRPPDPKKNMELVLEFAAKMAPLAEDSFPLERKETLVDGRIRVFLTVPDDEWVLGMILSYGPYVRVLAPDHLRDAVISSAKKIITLQQS